MNTREYINRRKQRKMQRVISAYLKHKGHEAQVYKFTAVLFKVPSYRVAGLKIAVQDGEYLGKSCVFDSLIV